MKSVWIGLLWLCLAWSQSSPPALRDVSVSVPFPCQIRYRLTSEGTWTQVLKEPRGGSVHIQLPKETLVLEVTHSTWLRTQIASKQLDHYGIYFDFHDADFHTQPNWMLVVSALALAGLGLGLGYRRHKSAQLHDASLLEPLIRSDGKIPKRKVGDYRLVSILGSGGMGVVYKGESSDGMQVAIKVPAPHLITDKDFSARFEREVKLGLNLRHPRVVQVLELPVSSEHYVVMEYVDGTPLNHFPLEPWAVESKRCLTWAAQALDALAYIHSQGIIHRDLKPSNLMILKDRSLKLMDFGIAHELKGTRITGTGNILGTPIYMAPEQLQGHELDARADLYSLGLILYERLMPGLPYPEDVIEMMRHKMTYPLPPLAAQNSQVPPALDEFLHGLVALAPEFRFPSAQAALLFLKEKLGVVA